MAWCLAPDARAVAGLPRSRHPGYRDR